MSLRGPFPRHWARATQVLSKKCCSSGKFLATLSSISLAQDLNLRPPAPETNALPLDQCFFIILFALKYIPSTILLNLVVFNFL